MKLRSLVYLNVVLLALAVAATSMDAQFGPERKNCCKTNSELQKYCCEGCCVDNDSGRCSSTRDCKPADQ